MLRLPFAKQLKGLSREKWKEHRPTLFKTLQESRDLEKTLTSRFPYRSLRGNDGCRPFPAKVRKAKRYL